MAVGHLWSGGSVMLRAESGDLYTPKPVPGITGIWSQATESLRLTNEMRQDETRG